MDFYTQESSRGVVADDIVNFNYIEQVVHCLPRIYILEVLSRFSCFYHFYRVGCPPTVSHLITYYKKVPFCSHSMTAASKLLDGNHAFNNSNESIGQASNNFSLVSYNK